MEKGEKKRKGAGERGRDGGMRELALMALWRIEVET